MKHGGSKMIIYQVGNKRDFMPLLLIGDEEERMILKYLDRGSAFVIDEGGVKGIIVVTAEPNGILEIKNLAVLPEYQKMGYGRALIEFVCERYGAEFSEVQVGTGDSPLTIPFYEKCGFVKSHTVKNFFTDNYTHPVIEKGKRLVDMIYLKRALK